MLCRSNPQSRYNASTKADESRIFTYLAFDGVICEDIKQLVEDFKPGQVAERSKKLSITLFVGLGLTSYQSFFV